MDHETLVGFTKMLYNVMGRLTACGSALLSGRWHATGARVPEFFSDMSRHRSVSALGLSPRRCMRILGVV